MKKRPMGADGADLERRKSRRFPVVVPVEVSWPGPDGMSLKEDAVARLVNDKGGFLKMANYPRVGTRVTLANFLSAQTAEARVLASPDSRPGVASGIVIEFIVPSETFWGVDLQVNKTIVELLSLEKALKSEEIDLSLVREYRDAMDYIFSVTETLRRLRTAKPRAHDAHDVHSGHDGPTGHDGHDACVDRELLSALAADRLRRATSACHELAADLDAGHIRQDTPGVDQLLASVQQLQQRLKQPRVFATTRQSTSPAADRT